MYCSGFIVPNTVNINVIPTIIPNKVVRAQQVREIR